MRVAAYSFDVRRGEVKQNLARVESGLRAAREQACDLVVLPEMWTTSFADFGPGEQSGSLFAESERALDRVRELSRELDLVVAGTAPAAVSEGLPFNRLTIFARGERVLEYDKLHLFSLTAEENSFGAGALPPGVLEPEQTGLACLTGVICYDLRFGETLLPAMKLGAELVVVPAQWPETRATHWRALVIGRAVEHQCFVVGCNRIGTELIGRRGRELAFPDNSLIVDPHGRVLAEGPGRDGLVSAEIDLDVARRLRVHVPIAKDRREDLYSSW